MSAAPGRDVKAANVAAYKSVLRNILEERPSGTRQRLASALGKNRSFISHMCNPAYPSPIPAPHIEIIFDICHFPPAQRRSFLKSFERAHPNRMRQARGGPALRSLKIEVCDLGSEKRNRAFDELVRETTRRLALLIAHGD